MGLGMGIPRLSGGGVNPIIASGANLALWFDENQAYKSSGGGIVTPDSILTYTAPSPKLVYGSDGVLRYAPHNLLLRSEEFDNAAWVKVSGITVTANQIPGPTGKTTADLVLKNATGLQAVRQSVTLASNATVTQRVWAKSGNADYIAFTDGASCVLTVSLIDGSVTRNTGAFGNVAVTLEGGFYRISFTQVLTAGAQNILYMWPTDTANSAGFTTVSATASMYLWGAQLNLGSSALTYIPTTTAAVYSLPRDYNPTTGAALGVLVEEQRTNLLLWSEQFDNAAWTKTRTTVTANAIAAPDGTLTADKVAANTTETAIRQAFQVGKSLSAVPYTWSFYGKAAELSWATINSFDGLNRYTYFNLSNGTIGGIHPGASATITDVGDGWYRCTVTMTAAVTANGGLSVELTSGNAVVTPTLTSGNGIFVWGAQLEAGAFATSYIPTTNNPLGVTRAADQVSILTSAFPYSTSAFTLVAEYDHGYASNAASARRQIVCVNDNSNSRLVIRSTDGATNALAAYGSGAAVASLGPAALVAANTFAKVAFGADATGGAFYQNGSVIGTSVLAPSVATGTLGIGKDGTGNFSYLDGHIKRLAYYASRKTNAELQVLSS